MNLSAAHQAARVAAARLPALGASFALLDSGAGQARIDILDADDVVLASVPIANGVGSIDEPGYRIVLTVPIEGQITTAGTPTHAAVYTNTGALWADGLTVSDDAPESTGDIKLASTTLHAGAFVRIASAVFQG